MSYLFYVSYSRDDYSPELQKFVQDLSTELRNWLGVPRDEPISFLDKEAIALSEAWNVELLNALQTSRVLLSLYSPRYFMRELCGREVSFFLERVHHSEQTQDLRKFKRPYLTQYILPVIWVPPDEHAIPHILRDVQIYRDDLPREYRQFGLRRLAIIRKNEDTYREVVFSLAQSIRRAVVELPELPPLDSVPPLDKLPNAFADFPESVHTFLPPDGPEPVPLAEPKARIFICYRHQETAWQAGWLNERMRAHFGDEAVFVDRESIEPGEDFELAINRTLTGCEGVVVLIGKDWLELKDGNGQRRLEDENDYVRREIATALAKGIRVIPVLVDEASMPKREQLPDDMKTFSTRNAISTSADRFMQDTDRLMKSFKRSQQ